MQDLKLETSQFVFSGNFKQKITNVASGLQKDFSSLADTLSTVSNGTI